MGRVPKGGPPTGTKFLALGPASAPARDPLPTPFPPPPSLPLFGLGTPNGPRWGRRKGASLLLLPAKNLRGRVKTPPRPIIRPRDPALDPGRGDSFRFFLPVCFFGVHRRVSPADPGIVGFSNGPGPYSLSRLSPHRYGRGRPPPALPLRLSSVEGDPEPGGMGPTAHH